MTVTPPHRVVLTPTQLRTIHTQIQQATSSAGMLAGIFAAMRAMVDDPIDQGAQGDRDTQAPPRRVPINDYVIPAGQWRAIFIAAVERVREWGTAFEVALELGEYLPGSFDDPVIPAPTGITTEYGSWAYRVELTPAAVQVLRDAQAHLTSLAAQLGSTGVGYQIEAHSLLRWVMGLLTGEADTPITVDADAAMSLITYTGAGRITRTRWRSLPQRCTACRAPLPDDATAAPPDAESATPPRAGQAPHVHTPPAPGQGPRPGEWVPES